MKFSSRGHYHGNYREHYYVDHGVFDSLDAATAKRAELDDGERVILVQKVRA